MGTGEGVEEVRLATAAPETAYYLVEAGATRVVGAPPTHAGPRGLSAKGPSSLGITRWWPLGIRRRRRGQGSGPLAVLSLQGNPLNGTPDSPSPLLLTFSHKFHPIFFFFFLLALGLCCKSSLPSKWHAGLVALACGILVP